MLGTLGVGAVALLAVLCCAGPALLAAGVLGAVGAWLASPWLIAAVLALLAAVTVWRLRRRAPRTAADPAHTKPSRTSSPAGPAPPRPADPTRSVER